MWSARGRHGLRKWGRHWGPATAAVLCAALGCGSKSDDERWLELINSSPVYSYAALKILIAEPDRDDDVRDARRLLDGLVSTPGSVANKDTAESARQALAFARALWKLRAMGKEEVGKGRDSKLLVLSPPAVGPEGPVNLLTANAEHGFLLLALLLLQLDSRSPVPVPPEVLLYEAHMTGLDPLPEPLLAGLVLSAQTAVTAQAELCDVAGRFSDHLVNTGLQVDHGAANSLLTGLVGASALDDANAANDALARTLLDALPWGLRLLAHGRAAVCFDKREQTDRGRIEWERAVALAGQAGVPEADLAIIRAYGAYRARDWPATRKHLRMASDSTLLEPHERDQVRQMAERFDEADPGAFESLFDRAFVARTVLSMVHRRLRDAGVYEQLATLPEVARARKALESIGGISLEEEGAGVWQRVRRLWGD
jgi:hypothetical protein